VGECFFWYRPTRVPVVPDQRPLNSGVASIWRYGAQGTGGLGKTRLFCEFDCRVVDCN